MKLFSRQLVAKQKCDEDWNHNEKLRYYPKLEQWLQVVGINEEAIKVHVHYFAFTLTSIPLKQKKFVSCMSHGNFAVYALFSPLHPQLNTTANQDVLHMQRFVQFLKSDSHMHLFSFLSDYCELPIQGNTR